ncbi:MAG TPA: NAD-binding protein, partial [Longimicrobiales bacterium]|nr:NAD-binding protein [Longimicrobiales bacterium]
MRIVVIGTSSAAVDMIDLLVGRGHDVIVVESDPERIEDLEDSLDVSFLQGDATRPEVLRETDPEGSDVLIALTGEDQDNILACLVGRSLGFPRVIPRIDSRDFEELCQELGLDEAVVPDRTIGRYLADLVQGVDSLQLRTLIKGEARFFS